MIYVFWHLLYSAGKSISCMHKNIKQIDFFCVCYFSTTYNIDSKYIYHMGSNCRFIRYNRHRCRFKNTKHCTEIKFVVGEPKKWALMGISGDLKNPFRHVSIWAQSYLKNFKSLPFSFYSRASYVGAVYHTFHFI